MEQCHILLVAFPGQGLINPALQFAKRLTGMGVKVTFVTAFSALNSMTKAIPTPQGLSVVGFSDGYDDGLKAGYDRIDFISQLKRLGSEAIKELITDSADKGRPFTHLIYTTLLSWAAEVAHSIRFPSTLLWVQPATVLDIYYYYSNGYTEDIQNITKDSSLSIQLPGLPTLTKIDLPSFMIPSDSSTDVVGLSIIMDHIEILDAETKPKVLVNTFDALEAEAVRAINKLNLIPIGPLIPSAFLDERDPSDTCFGGDIFQKSSDHNEFLNSKPDGSVVYVSFGSVCPISKQQLEEIARGLLESHRPFLWVIRPEKGKEKEKEEEKLSCIEELKKQGMIVSWCSQVEVLSHPSVGCFVSHCGWNSSLESLVCGVPVVGFPQWSDQGTNAKLINDVWKTGVRVTTNGEGFVKGEEIARCIDLVMGGGDRAEEMRRNAMKWRDLAREAVKDGGSSDMNLKAFLSEI